MERNLSNLAKFLRKIRIDNSEVMKDMAKRLGMSSAYLSTIESGIKPVPNDFYDMVKIAYNLNGQQKNELLNYIAELNKRLSISLEPYINEVEKLQTLFQFVNNFEFLDEATLKNIQDILDKVNSGQSKIDMAIGNAK